MRKIIEAINSSLPKVIFIVGMVIIIMSVNLSVYIYGFYQGYANGANSAGKEFALFKINLENLINANLLNKPSPTPTTIIIEKTKEATPQPAKSSIPDWTGPELWEAVNKRRLEFGINPLNSRAELCTIASIRLNELLDLGELDGHEGFSNLAQRRPDLEWIFDKYNLSEFLVQGATSAGEAVNLWENTLGHRKLLDGGEYVWGCIYGQNGFGVAIAAY